MFYTCGRGADTHGDVLNVHTDAFWMDTRLVSGVIASSHSVPEVHQKKRNNLTHLKIENKSRTARSRFLQSFALSDEAIELQLS